MKLNLKPQSDTKAAGSLLVHLSPGAASAVDEMSKPRCKTAVVNLAVMTLYAIVDGADELIEEMGERLDSATDGDSYTEWNLRCLADAVGTAAYYRTVAMEEIE